MGTLSWRWSESAWYDCDLGFVPTAWVPNINLIEVGTFANWVAPRISGHVPVIDDIDLP